jgi:HSP20 family molecular chaperone IbpA
MFFSPVHPSRAVLGVPAARGFDRQFERFVQDVFAPAQPAGAAQPQQDAKSWTLSIDVPGVPRDDLAIEVDGTVVRIATRPEAKRQVRLAYELPQEIDAEATTAKLEHGVLTLVLARKQPVVTARRIEIA